MVSYDLHCAVLTRDEQSVLTVSATGRGVAKVAEFLELPDETVRRLIASAVEKLGARSKLEAVILAIRDGLIDLSAVEGTESAPSASN